MAAPRRRSRRGQRAHRGRTTAGLLQVHRGLTDRHTFSGETLAGIVREHSSLRPAGTTATASLVIRILIRLRAHSSKSWGRRVSSEIYHINYNQDYFPTKIKISYLKTVIFIFKLRGRFSITASSRGICIN